MHAGGGVFRAVWGLSAEGNLRTHTLSALLAARPLPNNMPPPYLSRRNWAQAALLKVPQLQPATAGGSRKAGGVVGAPGHVVDLGGGQRQRGGR